MTFARPIWLLVGAAACAALVLLFVRAARKRRQAVQLLAAASPAVSVALHRRVLRDVLAVLGTGLAFVALARPLGGYRLESTPTHGVDLMFAVDTSKSMRAADIKPDRLTRAKLAVADLAKSFDGARLGLIAFAGDAFVQAPMTADRPVFLEALDALDTDVIPRGGTDVASAIHAAEQALATEPDHHKVLVLLSDGEDLAGSAVAAARDAAAHGLTIYTVGVGSEAGALIEVPDATGAPQLVRDEAGNPVRSHLDEATLRAIAQITGGMYTTLGADGRGLAALYATARAHLPQTSAAGLQRRVYAERFQIPLALAIACLLAELVIGDRRRARHRLGRLGAAAVVAIVPAVASAAPVGDYNAGTSSYRKGDFAGAERQFEAALHTSDVQLQANAYYDLGNARYRAGQATLAKQDRAATIQQWKQAVAAYDAALALAPQDVDAKFNRDFVAQKLAALEKEQQQQSGQQQSGKNQSGQQQSGQQQSGQQQSGQQSGQQQSGQQQRGQQNGHDQSGKNQGDQQQRGQQAGNHQKGPQPGSNQSGRDQHDQQNGNEPNGHDQDANASAGSNDTAPRGGSERTTPDAADHATDTGNDRIGTVGGAARSPDRARAADVAAQARADAARRAAGQLTRGEAVQLLDSVAHDLRPMPIHGRGRANPNHTTTKDW